MTGTWAYIRQEDISGYVNQFSDLPSPSSFAGKFYWVQNSQGTKWWPFTFKNKGLYFSDGTTWTSSDLPFQATQSEVDIGTNNENFVTPYTFINAIKWATKSDVGHTHVKADIVDFNENDYAENPNTVVNVKTLAKLLEIHPPNVNNEIQLDNKTYRFDSTMFDLTGYKLLGHPSGTTITGYSQNINNITSSEPNISLITSSGNLFIKHIQFIVTGSNSQVIKMTGATGQEALDMFYTSFINCTAIGTLDNLRQSFGSAVFALNCGKGFLLKGTSWNNGGFTIFDSRVINVANYFVKGDTGFQCNTIRSNVYATVPTSAVAFSFDYPMFSSDNGYQLDGGRYEGTGLMVSPFTTGDTTATQNSVKSLFNNNKGALAVNTYIGAEWITTTQVTTPLTLNTPAKLLGTVTYTNEVHFTHTTNNSIVYNSTVPRIIDIQGNIYLLGGANDIVDLTVRQWVNATSSYVNLQTNRRVIVSSTFGDDVADYNFFLSTTVNYLDRIEIFTTNASDSDDVTKIIGSKLKVSKKP